MYINYNELYHFGIKGQRWGVRRFQNEDGSLTEAGKKQATLTNRDNKTKNERKLIREQARAERSIIKEQSKADNRPAILQAKNERKALKNQAKNERKALKDQAKQDRMNNKARKQRNKLIAATAVAVAAIGAYTLTKKLKGSNSSLSDVVGKSSGTKVKDIASEVIDADFTVIKDTPANLLPMLKR